MQRKQQIIQGNILSYLDNEKKELPVLLFLHGWGCQADTFQSMFPYFSPESFRIISIDFPGFGQSNLPKNGLNIDQYKEILIQFLDKLKIQKVHCITHSFGGRVAIALAEKNSEYVQSLTLINNGGIKNTSLKVKIISLLAKIGKKLSLHKCKELFYKLFINETDALAVQNNPDLKKTFQNIVNEDLQDRAKNIHCPSLILWGEKDESTPLWHGETWHKLISKSQFFTHPGDHFFFLKDPQWTSQKILDFIQSTNS